MRDVDAATGDHTLMADSEKLHLWYSLFAPHSNAEEECTFNLVTKNKTKFHTNLKLDGTLSSILAIKLVHVPNTSQPRRCSTQ